jgi:hypothetical protein
MNVTKKHVLVIQLAGCARLRVKWRGISELLFPRRTKALISAPAIGADALFVP